MLADTISKYKCRGTAYDGQVFFDHGPVGYWVRSVFPRLDAVVSASVVPKELGTGLYCCS